MNKYHKEQESRLAAPLELRFLASSRKERLASREGLLCKQHYVGPKRVIQDAVERDAPRRHSPYNLEDAMLESEPEKIGLASNSNSMGLL